MASFLKVLGLIPEIWAIFKKLVASVESGVDQAVLRKRLKAVTKAFDNQDRRKAAKDLDDVFKKD